MRPSKKRSKTSAISTMTRTSTSIWRQGAGAADMSARRDAVELARLREQLVQRAVLERYALRETTADLQAAGDGIVRIAVTTVGLVRRFWLPLTALTAMALVTG